MGVRRSTSLARLRMWNNLGGRDCLTASNQAGHSFPSGDREAGASVRVVPGPFFRGRKLTH